MSVSNFHGQVAPMRLAGAMRSGFLPRFLLAMAVLALTGLIAAAVIAQIEGGNRGIPAIDSSSSFEVSGIEVDVRAPNANAARIAGWRVAQRKGWQALWSRTHGGARAPALPDSALDAIVAGIVVENEQIGATRYIARLGVLFDRARAGQILGVSGRVQRSPPLLVIPVMWSGGTPQSFEGGTIWQAAWARFRTGGSPIDYVRPSGTGSDPLLLNIGLADRPFRRQWRQVLDLYGAADVLIPQVRLERQWPGGPVIGRFSARYGPDNRILETFALRAPNSESLPAMLDEGVKRLDAAYTRALRDGRLRPDPSLIIEPELQEEELPEGEEELIDGSTPVEETSLPAAGNGTVISVQFDTPDVGSVSAGESALRAIAGVRSASTTSLALGGVSVMRVQFAGNADALAAALRARGWQVSEGENVLRIRRTAPPANGDAPAP